MDNFLNAEGMNGFIDKEGDLFIIRGGDPKPQQCCHGSRMLCGDKCPHFSEPIQIDGGWVILKVCLSKVIIFDEFWDKRGFMREKGIK